MPELFKDFDVAKEDLTAGLGNAVKVCEVEVIEDDVLSTLAIFGTGIILLTKIFWRSI